MAIISEKGFQKFRKRKLNKQTNKQVNKLISVEFPPIPPISNEYFFVFTLEYGV